MAKGPQRIGDVLSELMARRGFARVQSASAFEEAWRETAGSLAERYTRVGQLRGGVLEVVVANSTLVQELTLDTPRLIATMRERLPEQQIRDFRFRVGPVSRAQK